MVVQSFNPNWSLERKSITGNGKDNFQRILNISLKLLYAPFKLRLKSLHLSLYEISQGGVAETHFAAHSFLYFTRIFARMVNLLR